MEKKNYIDYIVEETKKILAIDSPSGYTKEVAEYVLGEYRALGYEPKLTVKGGVLVALGGKNKEDAVMLEAHIDTLGAIVTEIKSNGRLKVSPIGGMNANNAEAENCRVATRFSGTFEGTCQLSNASVHVNGDYSDTKRSWDEMEIVLDEKADSREETEKLGIMAGDFVCFDPRTTVTKTGYIKSRFLDDKLSVGILLGYAKIFKRRKYHNGAYGIPAYHSLRGSRTRRCGIYPGGSDRGDLRGYGMRGRRTFLQRNTGFHLRKRQQGTLQL